MFSAMWYCFALKLKQLAEFVMFGVDDVPLNGVFGRGSPRWGSMVGFVSLRG
jgi:hypothetical protein